MEAHLCFIDSAVRLECIVDARRGNAMSKERRWYDLKISVADACYQLGRSIASKEELQRTKKNELKLFQTLSTLRVRSVIIDTITDDKCSNTNCPNYFYPRVSFSTFIQKTWKDNKYKKRKKKEGRKRQ